MNKFKTFLVKSAASKAQTDKPVKKVRKEPAQANGRLQVQQIALVVHQVQ